MQRLVSLRCLKPGNPIVWLKQLTGCVSRTLTCITACNIALQTCIIKVSCQLRKVSGCIPALESRLAVAKPSDRAPSVALMLFEKASAKHLPVQRGQCFRTSDSCQAESPADASTQSVTAEPEATLVPQVGSAESKSCADKLSAAWLCDETSAGQLRLARFHRGSVSQLLSTRLQTLPKARTQHSPRQREEAKLSLLNKQGFWSYHMPVLVVRLRPVKSCLWRVSSTVTNLVLAVVMRRPRKTNGCLLVVRSSSFF